MYLAPLRLLAAEIYENLNAEGIYIDLLTGEWVTNLVKSRSGTKLKKFLSLAARSRAEEGAIFDTSIIDCRTRLS